MKLHDDWKWIVANSWSLRFIAAAFMLSALETFLNLISSMHHMPQGLFALLSALVTAGAFVARLLAQKHPIDVDPTA